MIAAIVLIGFGIFVGYVLLNVNRRDMFIKSLKSDEAAEQKDSKKTKK